MARRPVAFLWPPWVAVNRISQRAKRGQECKHAPHAEKVNRSGKMASRLPVVGVMGSGDTEHADKAEPLGRWLAAERVHLLTGAGQGVMAAVSRAFHSTPGRAGLVVGVAPCGDPPDSPRAGYPNQWVELVIRTHLPLSG